MRIENEIDLDLTTIAIQRRSDVLHVFHLKCPHGKRQAGIRETQEQPAPVRYLWDSRRDPIGVFSFELNG